MLLSGREIVIFLLHIIQHMSSADSKKNILILGHWGPTAYPRQHGAHCRGHCLAC